MMASPIGMEHLVFARRLVLLVPKLCLGTSMGKLRFTSPNAKQSFGPVFPNGVWERGARRNEKDLMIVAQVSLRQHRQCSRLGHLANILRHAHRAELRAAHRA